MTRDHLFVRDGVGDCEVHGWTPEQWRQDFVRLLRERHGRGGLNVCQECLQRAYEREEARKMEQQ